ncbi:MAG TPA: hypothetical protein PKA55_11680 [Rhodoblastus sp.]|nr:hypothetical protein [Rhodoblastus sp.]
MTPFAFAVTCHLFASGLRSWVNVPGREMPPPDAGTSPNEGLLAVDWQPASDAEKRATERKNKQERIRILDLDMAFTPE